MQKRVLIFLVFVSLLYADDALKQLFSERGVTGTIVISALDGSKEYVYNNERAQKQFLPASTFKILNSLISLKEKAVSSIDDTIPWDGIDKGWAPWNKDHTMKSAFPLSCVWFYQELAKRVGNKKYLALLKDCNYGNAQTGSELTTFWLNGDLKISAREQIVFLRNFYNKQLPFSAMVHETVKDLMLVEYADTYSLYAKSGWAKRIPKQHGWYVGILEAKGKVWLFAMNLDIIESSDKNYRKEITIEAIKALKLLS